jgi:hypothetical protein
MWHRCHVTKRFWGCGPTTSPHPLPLLSLFPPFPLLLLPRATFPPLIVLHFGFCEQRNRRRDLWISAEVTETLYLLQFIVCLLCVFVLVSCLDSGKKSMALENPSDFLDCTFWGWQNSCPKIYRARGRCGLRGWNRLKI